MTNKDRANRIKKILGLQGDKSNYYRVADVICDLMHYCEHYKKHPDDDEDINFNNELTKAEKFYYEETK